MLARTSRDGCPCDLAQAHRWGRHRCLRERHGSGGRAVFGGKFQYAGGEGCCVGRNIIFTVGGIGVDSQVSFFLN